MICFNVLLCYIPSSLIIGILFIVLGVAMYFIMRSMGPSKLLPYIDFQGYFGVFLLMVVSILNLISGIRELLSAYGH